MPSKKRDYKREYEKYHSRPEQIKKRAMRNAARAKMEKALGKPIKGDVDHKKPLSKGGSNDLKNLRVQSASDNRSFARTSTGKPK